jgi:hypothetical protein
VLGPIKDPDGWQALLSDLGLTYELGEEFLEFGEYADIRLDVTYVPGEGPRPARLVITGGEILRRDRRC